MDEFVSLDQSERLDGSTTYNEMPDRSVGNSVPPVQSYPYDKFDTGPDQIEDKLNNLNFAGSDEEPVVKKFTGMP